MPASALETDYFTDHAVLLDPYEFLEGIRAHGPVVQLKSRDIVAVTGFAEAVEVLNNREDFSSVINPDPIAPLRFVPEGDDISAQIEATMGTGPMDLMVSYDGKLHADARSLTCLACRLKTARNSARSSMPARRRATWTRPIRRNRAIR